MSQNEQNKQTVKHFMEVFSTGNVDATMALMADSATWWVAGTMPISGTYNKAQFRELLSGVGASCEGGAIKLVPKAFTAEGERVAVETESFASLNNGRKYNNHYHFLFTVRDGKIMGVKEYLDTMHTQAVICTP